LIDIRDVGHQNNSRTWRIRVSPRLTPSVDPQEQKLEGTEFLINQLRLRVESTAHCACLTKTTRKIPPDQLKCGPRLVCNKSTFACCVPKEPREVYNRVHCTRHRPSIIQVSHQYHPSITWISIEYYTRSGHSKLHKEPREVYNVAIVSTSQDTRQCINRVSLQYHHEHRTDISRISILVLPRTSI
jgi:hypothetical protein